ncbi:MAG TPA: class I SAM-dependent methyltransferase [Pirellulales bacterium]|nr:class I SAM-dependent methyltransferase [Pirellulales bacterium]
MAETRKAARRRNEENWFARFAPDTMPGIYIGVGDDPLCASFRRWDTSLGDGDATFMAGVPDQSYFTVYASHVLEHLADPVTALRNWYRVLMRGGHLIVCVPHRDLYEKRIELPSLWNAEHTTYWLPELGAARAHEPPHTRGLADTLATALPDADLVSLRVLDEGFFDPGPEQHSHGEYSIEAVVQKA